MLFRSPTVGADGVAAGALITTFPDDAEIHPDASVTVYVYVPEINPEIVVVVPVPVVVIPPGERSSVQIPVAGKPSKATLPVASAQVGWVIVPNVGGDGKLHNVIIVTSFP